MTIVAAIFIAVWYAPGAMVAAPAMEADPAELISAPGGPSGLLAARILDLPRPMVAADKAYLIYELSLTNYQTKPISLVSVEASGLDPRMGHPAAIGFRFDGEKLAGLIRIAGHRESHKDLSVLEPGGTSIVMMWLPFESLQAVPANLTHRLTYRFVPGNGVSDKAMTVRMAPMKVREGKPLVIGPPLRGENWIAGNAPSETSPHRRAYMVDNGSVHFPERYAIDFVQIGANGETFSGDPARNESYHCYLADVLAVADGTIVVAKDGMPENRPGEDRAVPMTLESLPGNYLMERIGQGEYAFYAHLVPNRIKVKVGDRVKRGDVLAKLGNSGNSTEPHLHFHIGERPTPLGSDGIPYALDRIAVKPGSTDMKGDRIRFTPSGAPPRSYRDSLVLDGEVIDFPAQ